MKKLSSFQVELLNRYQKNFPICEKPFKKIAQDLGTSEQHVLDELRHLQEEGVISRIGPVYKPFARGVSTLAAMSVPVHRLDEVARIVSGYQEVNHNYERSDDINLWFVVTAKTEERLIEVLREIEKRTGISVYDLRLMSEFRIDLGFGLSKWVEATVT